MPIDQKYSPVFKMGKFLKIGPKLEFSEPNYDFKVGGVELDLESKKVIFFQIDQYIFRGPKIEKWQKWPQGCIFACGKVSEKKDCIRGE